VRPGLREEPEEQVAPEQPVELEEQERQVAQGVPEQLAAQVGLEQ